MGFMKPDCRPLYILPAFLSKFQNRLSDTFLLHSSPSVPKGILYDSRPGEAAEASGREDHCQSLGCDIPCIMRWLMMECHRPHGRNPS